MYAIFLTTVAAGGMYFLLAHRRFDAFSLAFVSACVYFLPGFFGAVRDPASDVPVPVEHGTYVVMTAVLAAIALGGWLCSDSVADASDAAPVTDRQGTWIALLIAVASLAIALVLDGNIYFSAAKGDVLGGMSRWYRLHCVTASLAAVMAFAHRQRTPLLLAAAMLLFNVYVGFRATAAITVLAIFLVHFHRQGPHRFLRRNRTATIVGAASAAFFFVYKAVYALIKLGEYETVHEKLGDHEFYVSTVIDSEPFVTQCILNEVVRTDFQTDGNYILTGIASQFTFFGNELGIDVTSFNDLFQPVLFGDVSFGLAGNVWAEMFAAGGWPLLGCFLLAFVVTLRLISRWLCAAHTSSQVCVALSAAYLAFFLHRTDIGFQLTLQKRLLACWFIVVCVSEVLHQLNGRRRLTRRTVIAGAPVTGRRLPASNAEVVHS